MSDSLLYVNAQSQPAVINAADAIDKDVGGIIRRITYLNFTPQPVYVVERDGLHFIVNSTPNRFSQQFVIRTEYLIPRIVFRAMAALLSATIDVTAQSKLAVIRDLFFKQYTPTQQHVEIIRIVVDTGIDQKQLISHRGLYINNHDCVLTTQHSAALIPHPFSAAALLCERYKALTQHAGVSLAIEVIDNEHVLQSRYVTLANEIVHVKPVQDVTRDSGIYFTRIDHTVLPPAIDQRRYSFEEGEIALGLYRTQEETRLAGDVKTARLEEIARITHEHALTRLELQTVEQTHKTSLEQLRMEAAKTESRVKEYERENRLLEQQYARERTEMEKELQRLRAQYEARKVVREDHYSERSAERKDSSELVKFIPVLVAAGLAIWVAILKSKAA